MNRRSFLLSTAVAATVALAPVPLLAKSAAPLAKKRMTVLGHEIAYTDIGQGRPVVFLHGNPASSYLWRNIIPYVSASHRAIAPDLMGMGDSDKPKMTDTYLESRDYLFAFLDSLDLQNAVLVIHDWGSALGWEYARKYPERVSAIAFMEAVAPPFMPVKSYDDFGPFKEFIQGVKTPGIGEQMILEQNVMLDQFMRHDSKDGALPDAVMAEYNRYYPTPESRQILLDWPREIPVAGEPADVHAIVEANSEWLLKTEFPKLMFHVTPGAIINDERAAYLKANLKNLESIYLGAGGHFIQEDYPDEIGQGLADWLTRV